jgi:PAS domain S-box-containing protein
MAQGSDGTIWLGTWDSGVRRFDPATGQFTIYRSDPRSAGSLSGNQVNALCVDKLGTLWVAASTGLNRFDSATHTFMSYDERDGLPNSNVNGILEDERGDLWLSTSNGISRFDPRAKEFKNYSVSDGLPGNEFYGANAGFKSRTGEMFFSSRNGLTTFFPDKVTNNASVPPVVLTDFQLFGKPVPVAGNSPLRQAISATRSLTLSHAQSIFSFEFSALSYANPEKNRYRYRLEELEQKWNETDSGRRFVTYTTLAPRDYVFRVQGSNNHGVWNEEGVSLRIRILPPWWSTWWFRASVAGLLLLLLWGLYHIRVRQLQRQERELRDVINAVPANIWSTSPDGAVDFVNQRWQELTGLLPADASGWNWEAAVHPDDRASFVDHWQSAVKNGTTMEREVRVRRADGGYRWLFVRNVPLRDVKGNIVKWYGTSFDIDDRKRAEETLRQTQADLAHMNRVSTMGELAASLAHEIKQPLSGVVVNAHACLRWLAGDSPNLVEARENANRIARDGKRAGDIISRIQALAQKTTTAMAPMDINEAIHEVITLARPEVGRNNVTLRAKLADDLSPVLGDRVQLQQVVLNLVMNAVEAMSAVGDRPRELVIRTQNDEADLVRITVQDSGTGLDPQTMERIFDAFYTTKSGGMGMGLSICRSIVRNHGGRLWAVANDGPGTTFQFTVPRYDIATWNSVA